MKAEVKSEEPAGPPKAKKAKTETIAKSAQRVVTTLVALHQPKISLQQAVVPSKPAPPHKLSVLSGPPHPSKGMYLEKLIKIGP